jgi:DNA replication licensing factor MCM3
MGESDRVAIHEAMEQQTVTIAKAGIHASLNARCSVLAAANPVYGQYNRKKRIQENIGLPDSLLSRFDLLFVVLDQLDPNIDRKIASHVIRGHRYRPGNGLSGRDSDYEDDDSDDEAAPHDETGKPKVHSIWARSQHSSHQEYTLTQAIENDDPHAGDVLQHDFLRKFLHFAKTRMKPSLTDSAREYIASRYAEMRSRQDERTLPVTARSLETVIRLASAHAKVRLVVSLSLLKCRCKLDLTPAFLSHFLRLD